MTCDDATATRAETARADRRVRAVLLLTSTLAYLIWPALAARPFTPSRFEQLASAMATGRVSFSLDVDAPTLGDVNELIPDPDARGRFFCAYPPLPALLLLPMTFLGLPIGTALLARLISVLNLLLFDMCLARAPALLGRSPLPTGARVAFDLLFGSGTVTWHNAAMGGDWHLAHAAAVCGLLLALHEFAGPRRPLVVGVFVALAMGARPTTALTAVFFLLGFVRATQADRRRALCLFGIGPAAACLLLGAYNAARFGSPLDFGYERMILIGTGADLLRTYGQFHPHFIPTNLYWFFAAPPVALAGGRPPFVGYDPRGMSLFIASPALALAVVGIVRHWRLPTVRHAAAGIACCLVPLLMYFNTGFWQFGHRFSMDYLPVLMLLVLAGAGARPRRIAYALIAASILFQSVGVLMDPARGFI